MSVPPDKMNIVTETNIPWDSLDENPINVSPSENTTSQIPWDTLSVEAPPESRNDQSELIQKFTQDIDTDSGATRPNLDSSFFSSAMDILLPTIDDPVEGKRLMLTLLGSYGGYRLSKGLPPQLSVPLVTAGGILGATAPEITLEGMEFLGFLPDDARKEITIDNDELEAMFASELAMQTLFSGLGAGVRLGERGISQLASGVDKAGKELAAYAKDVAGIELTPGMVGTRNIADMWNNSIGRLPYFADLIAEPIGKAQIKLYEILNEIPERLQPAFVNKALIDGGLVSRKLFEDYKTLWTEWNASFNRKYAELYRLAEENGIKVEPKMTNAAVKSLMRGISELQPQKRKRIDAPRDISDLDKTQILVGKGSSLEDAAVKVAKPTRQEAVEIIDSAPQVVNTLLKEMQNLDTQSFAQMQELLRNFNLYKSNLVEASDTVSNKVAGRAISLLQEVEKAIKADLTDGLVLSKGGDPLILKQLRNDGARLQADYYSQMATLFETPTAKRFEKVQRGGIKGVDTPSEAATMINPDRTMDVLLNLDSPEAIKELRDMIGEDNFNSVAGMVFSRAIAKNFIDEASVFVDDAGQKIETEIGEYAIKNDGRDLRKFLGLGSGDQTRQRALQALIAESNLDPRIIEGIPRILAALNRQKAPGASTMIQRRILLGGTRAVTNLLTLGAIGGSTVGLTGALMILFGTRKLSFLLNDPLNARALSQVWREDVGRVAKKQAFMNLVRTAIGLSVMEGQELTQDVKNAFSEESVGARLKAFKETEKKYGKKYTQQFIDGADLFFEETMKRPSIPGVTGFGY
tara:strand:- start:6769 stop:9186 length:2418 start_codon:yes stop_codon:yes gene_type:complete